MFGRNAVLDDREESACRLSDSQKVIEDWPADVRIRCTEPSGLSSASATARLATTLFTLSVRSPLERQLRYQMLDRDGRKAVVSAAGRRLPAARRLNSP